MQKFLIQLTASGLERCISKLHTKLVEWEAGLKKETAP